MKYLFIAILLFSLTLPSLGQNRTIDSLKKATRSASNDTSKINALMTLGDKYQGINIDTAFYFHKMAKDISLKIKDEVRIADAIRQIGWDHYLTGNYDTAIVYYTEAISIADKNTNSKDATINRKAKKVKAAATGNMGGSYYAKGQYPMALDLYFKALRLAEEINNKKIIASNYANIGVVYDDMKEYDKALNSYLKALKLVEELDNKTAISISLGNIGSTYYALNNYPKAIEYYNKAFQLNEQIGRIGGAASNLGNLGNVYEEMGDREKAMDYYLKGLKRNEELGSEEGVCINLANIGSLQNKNKKYSDAESTLKKAYAIANKIGYLEMIKKSHEHLAYLYEQTGKHTLALDHYKHFIKLRDSMMNEESIKAGAQKELQFEFDKRTTADSVRTSEERKVMSAKLAQEKTQRFALYGGLILVLLFAGFMYNRFKVTSAQKRIIEEKEKETQRQNEIITTQKHLVEEKQKEILDSINYAKRIQYTLLAHHDFLKENIPEHFVYFNPKDIVSGDFYWANSTSSKFYLAVCDSTGHGVPGAFMSLLNISFLNEAINEKKIEEPHKILDFVRQRLVDNISKEGQKDGFDGILISIDKQNQTIEYAAANNAPVLIKNGEFMELAYDPMPVGMGERKNPFNLHSFNMNKGDTLFLYTDGYADQFGGPRGKKFMYKKLNALLTDISSSTMAEQKTALIENFVNWKGKLEQIDDVCIIGIRL